MFFISLLIFESNFKFTEKCLKKCPIAFFLPHIPYYKICINVVHCYNSNITTPSSQFTLGPILTQSLFKFQFILQFTLCTVQSKNSHMDFTDGPVVKTLLTMHGMRVFWSLVRELRSQCVPCSMAKFFFKLIYYALYPLFLQNSLTSLKVPWTFTFSCLPPFNHRSFIGSIVLYFP